MEHKGADEYVQKVSQNALIHTIIYINEPHDFFAFVASKHTITFSLIAAKL
jgi:hypothetical protein